MVVCRPLCGPSCTRRSSKTLHNSQIFKSNDCATTDAAKAPAAASRWAAVSATRCASARLRSAWRNRTDGRRAEIRTADGCAATARRRAAAGGSELRITTRIRASVRAAAAGRRTTALRAAGDGRAAVRGAARARLCVARRRAAEDHSRRAAAGPGLPVARRRGATAICGRICTAA